MTTINNIIQYVESLTGHPINGDEGVHFGPANREISGVTVAWMATPDAIRAAGKAGHELLIGHESLFYPYDVVNAEKPPAGWETWPVNAKRAGLLEQYGLTHLRLHGTVDEICILDDFANQLGLGKPVHNEGFVKIYEIPECSLGELAERVQKLLDMDGVRISGSDEGFVNMDRRVSRVGLPWGGMALFVNVGYQQKLIEQGCDVFIAGETDNYGFRFAQECGIPMIETSHEVSENRGLAHFTEILAAALQEVECRFFENPRVWKMYAR